METFGKHGAARYPLHAQPKSSENWMVAMMGRRGTRCDEQRGNPIFRTLDSRPNVKLGGS